VSTVAMLDRSQMVLAQKASTQLGTTVISMVPNQRTILWFCYSPGIRKSYY
jgi:hypothetical protein